MQLFRDIRARVPIAARADAGFTLIEAILAVALALIVLVPISTVLLDTQQAANGVIQRGDAVQAAQVGLRAMDQQLRDAYEIESPTTTTATGCYAVSNGVQPCNVIDVLTRTNGTDSEVRFDCTVASTTIAADRACWRYTCTASATTGSGSSCTPGTGVTQTLMIDEITNGTSASNAVFSFCYQSVSACSLNTTRPTSVGVTIDVPAAGTLSTTKQNGDPSTVQLTDTVYFANLDFNQ
jgi:Tfp pilus assembly protein PilX